MTKTQLLDLLATRHQSLPSADTAAAAQMLLDAIGDALASGNRIEIRGFGSFDVHTRDSRTGRNPRTGEKVIVPRKHVPHFKAGKELRERVDNGEADTTPRRSIERKAA